ncbi:hypothetical protein Fcan01_11268 [Folsomia candida]|uniref:Gustatory receptor n=1 Tax=Folsomia candida TaxID=158441 RepID=A0A226ECZ2_FOLCA|nr:hypothetical protein Fcan01_11268 [Folsomia candida]
MVTRILPLLSSNIPLVLSLSKVSIFLNQFPFTLKKGKFIIRTSTKCQRLTAILAILLHFVVALKWVLDQWLYPKSPASPIWKYVLMYYCIILLEAIGAFIVHISLLKEETVFLLNSALQVEQDSKMKGNSIVHVYYILFIALSIMAVILIPITGFAFGCLRPCMPPTWTSAINLGSVKTEGIRCLRTYRALQILTDMHNSVFRHPIMSILVGSITACESFALYTLITSSAVIPFPVLILFTAVGFYLFIVIIGPFKIMANPFVQSVELLHAFESMKGSKLIKRLVKSFPPSKLTLGVGRFFDRATSLVICSQCVDLLITFLLM